MNGSRFLVNMHKICRAHDQLCFWVPTCHMDSVTSSGTGLRLANFANVGFGNIQRNRWLNPRSAPVCCSMILRATPGCVNPPTVRAVRSIWKFAFPVTKPGDILLAQISILPLSTASTPLPKYTPPPPPPFPPFSPIFLHVNSLLLGRAGAGIQLISR